MVLSVLLLSSLLYVSMVPMGDEKRFHQGIEHLERGGAHLENGMRILQRGSYGQAAVEFGDASKEFLRAESVFEDLSRGEGGIAESAEKAKNYAFLARAGTRSLEAGSVKLSQHRRDEGQELIEQGFETLSTADTYLKREKGLEEVPEVDVSQPN